MNFYAYKGKNEIGKEPLGSDNKMIMKNVKTVREAIRRCNKLWGEGNYSLYSYSNFYDDTSFNRII